MFSYWRGSSHSLGRLSVPRPAAGRCSASASRSVRNWGSKSSSCWRQRAQADSIEEDVCRPPRHNETSEGKQAVMDPNKMHVRWWAPSLFFETIDAKATVPAAKQKNTWPVHTHTHVSYIYKSTEHVSFFGVNCVDKTAWFNEWLPWGQSSLQGLGSRLWQSGPGGTWPWNVPPNFPTSWFGESIPGRARLVPKVHDFFDIFWIQALHTVYSLQYLFVGSWNMFSPFGTGFPIGKRCFFRQASLERVEHLRQALRDAKELENKLENQPIGTCVWHIFIPTALHKTQTAPQPFLHCRPLP